ncbi:MAG TPA: arginase [Candidatus Paceibacterota bacterium]|nr:arginase [Candidatus Paceibacterota bacterium]
MERDNLSFYESQSTGTPVAIVNVPIEIGSDERGLAEAPKYLQERGLANMLAGIGRTISKKTNILCPKPAQLASAGAMKNVEAIVSVAKRTKSAVMRAGKRGDTVLALGGDHSLSLGSIAGASAAHPGMGLIYIDAHPDCTTDTTTISGNVHGMIVSSAIGQGNPLLTDLFTRKVLPENVLYIAVKDIDAGEIALMREQGIQSFTMLDIATRGLAPVVDAIEALGKRCPKVWVSLDLDSIDERFAPGVAMTTPDGLTRREIVALAHVIGRVCTLAGADIAEMVPGKDKEGITARLAIEVLARFLGGQWGWYEEYMDHYREINVTGEPEKVEIKRK